MLEAEPSEGYYSALEGVTMAVIITRINAVNISPISRTYFIGSIQISRKKFQRPKISTAFQKIMTVGIK